LTSEKGKGTRWFYKKKAVRKDGGARIINFFALGSREPKNRNPKQKNGTKSPDKQTLSGK